MNEIWFFSSLDIFTPNLNFFFQSKSFSPSLPNISIVFILSRNYVWFPKIVFYLLKPFLVEIIWTLYYLVYIRKWWWSPFMMVVKTKCSSTLYWLTTLEMSQNTVVKIPHYSFFKPQSFTQKSGNKNENYISETLMRNAIKCT